MSFPEFDLEDESADDQPPGPETWFLLHHRYVDTDQSLDELRLELSLPYAMDDTGHVSVWRERIILTPISLDGQGYSLTEPLQPIEPTEAIEIDIQRREP